MNTPERRGAPRWHACSNKFKVRVGFGGGRTSEATLIDVSQTGIGLRVDRQPFRVGMSTHLELDSFGEKIQVRGVVRFVDRFYPRVGLQVESIDTMERILQQVSKRRGFVMTEVKGDTLAVRGSLTHAATSLFSARHFRILDLSEVDYVSVAGSNALYDVTSRGVRIKRCSPSIAPFLDSQGICEGARLCTANKPCDLPKAWPTRKRGLHSDPACAGASPD